MTVRTADTPYVCGWGVDLCCDVLENAFSSGDTAQVALAQRSLNSAAEILYALSGRQFGLCTHTVRPCRTDCCDPCTGSLYQMSGYRWQPVLIGGQWTNVSCGSCGDTCSCTKVCEVTLPGPVYDVQEVKVDGTALDASTYRVDNYRSLVRVGGDECWPLCQDMNLNDTKTGTWSVTYRRGKPLPDSGRSALSELACELVKACIGDTSCCLPKRVTNITRQGVSFAMLDPLTFINEGRTGLYSVDAWLRAVNPKARVRSAGIYSPDIPTTRTTTWPAP